MSDPLPCPFCADPMRVNFDRIEHVEQTKGCPIRDLGWPIERLVAWNTRKGPSHE